MKKNIFVLLLSVVVLALNSGCKNPASRAAGHAPKPLSEIIGTAHVRGGYYLTKKDYLNEGADQVLALGSKVIKVWFHNGKETPAVTYPYNSTWPQAQTLVQCAELPYWRALFHKPFKTYILQVMATGHEEYYWLDGMTPEQQRDEQRQMYELAKHFLVAYRGTGKTFIFSNHETDWHLKKTNRFDVETPPQVLENAIKWFSARQAGVNQARAEVGMNGVNVFHAGEVVNVIKSMKEGQLNMVNVVLPKVKFDLISYSAWDSTVIGGVHELGELKQALDYIADKALDSEYFGNKNVFVGEYGIPENDMGEAAMVQVTKNVVETGLAWGCPYIVYWQLYCNEPKLGVSVPSRKVNDFRGFWLIRPDGSKTKVYDYFKKLLTR